MPISLIPSFLFYCFVSGITPGPANLCSLSAAMNYGKKEALRQWRGLFAGYAVVSVSSAFLAYFLGNIMNDFVFVFSIIGAMYIIYLAIHILHPSKIQKNGTEKNCCNFWSGFILQVTNVKVIIFCLTALTSYVVPYSNSFWMLLLTGFFLPFTGPITNLTWIHAGVWLKNVFCKHERVMNVLMAVSLLFCAVSLVFSH